ncbi:secreted frizzled-related protein 5-like isoform X2 [Lycorma delicatula]|uniref:secreted frizzled-related protein 5-like isoform X2 n=1 Tax=Lycorma delicatula TaxID=130591 RepID=UPI003F5163FB
MAAALLVVGSCLALTAVAAADLRPGFVSDWSLVGGRPIQPTCVDIPKNMSLCHNIGYNKMRLPNLLDHDTMAEVSQQAVSWVPLLNVRCHPDTQLFLCSLFSPVCLDRPIYPCRSLCNKVKQGCEGRMKTYGFPWPDMFRCDKFPLDNDMCIRPQSGADPVEGERCQVCNQVETYENILDNFCRADFALRAKFKRVKKLHLTCKKAKVLKGGGGGKLRHPVMSLDPIDLCCEEKTKSNRGMFLIMGVFRDSKLVPTFIMPWAAKNSKVKAI